MDPARMIAINCGGDELTDPDGVRWRADHAFDGAWGYVGRCALSGKKPPKAHTGAYQSVLAPEPLRVAAIKRAALPGFPPPGGDIRATLVSARRLACRIKAANGRYRVRLCFLKERGGRRDRNRRVGFDIVIEGRRVWRGLDMFRVRAAREFVRTFNGVTVSDGDLSIELLASFGYPYPPRPCGITLERLDERHRSIVRSPR